MILIEASKNKGYTEIFTLCRSLQNSEGWIGLPRQNFWPYTPSCLPDICKKTDLHLHLDTQKIKLVTFDKLYWLNVRQKHILNETPYDMGIFLLLLLYCTLTSFMNDRIRQICHFKKGATARSSWKWQRRKVRYKI